MTLSSYAAERRAAAPLLLVAHRCRSLCGSLDKLCNKSITNRQQIDNPQQVCTTILQIELMESEHNKIASSLTGKCQKLTKNVPIRLSCGQMTLECLNVAVFGTLKMELLGMGLEFDGLRNEGPEIGGSNEELSQDEMVV